MTSGTSIEGNRIRSARFPILAIYALRIRFPSAGASTAFRPKTTTAVPGVFGGTVGWRAKFPFSPKCLTDLAPIARDKRDHENLGRHFRPSADHHRLRDLFGCALTSAEVSHTSVPDPATAAIAHALKHG